ncbi:hypothetical protein CAPTEDRAFT_202766, partial [Capitella teleta]
MYQNEQRSYLTHTKMDTKIAQLLERDVSAQGDLAGAFMQSCSSQKRVSTSWPNCVFPLSPPPNKRVLKGPLPGSMALRRAEGEALALAPVWVLSVIYLWRPEKLKDGQMDSSRESAGVAAEEPPQPVAGDPPPPAVFAGDMSRMDDLSQHPKAFVVVALDPHQSLLLHSDAMLSFGGRSKPMQRSTRTFTVIYV